MTTPLKELVAEVELLSAQATEGPWYEEAASGDRNMITAIKSGDVGAIDKWVDAVFIAALRTAWPDVVKGIDELETKLGITEDGRAEWEAECRHGRARIAKLKATLTDAIQHMRHSDTCASQLLSDRACGCGRTMAKTRALAALEDS